MKQFQDFLGGRSQVTRKIASLLVNFRFPFLENKWKLVSDGAGTESMKKVGYSEQDELLNLIDSNHRPILGSSSSWLARRALCFASVSSVKKNLFDIFKTSFVKSNRLSWRAPYTQPYTQRLPPYALPYAVLRRGWSFRRGPGLAQEQGPNSN